MLKNIDKNLNSTILWCAERLDKSSLASCHRSYLYYSAVRRTESMIISMIKKLFSGTVYIQLREDRIKINHVETKTIYDQRPYIAIDISNSKKEIIHAIGNDAYNLRSNKGFKVSNPFSHPRVLISSFIKAEKVLMHGIREVHKSKLIAPSPVVIMHPMEKLEGGITDIECRVYRELALGAGAREVHLHVGNELNINLFSMDQVRAPESV